MDTVAEAATPSVQELFQRSLCAHLPLGDFAKLQAASVLVAGLGGGSNIAELLVRKGIGRLTIADLDVYEPHNIRQRGSMMSSLGRSKVEVMRERLLDINPNAEVTPVPEGIILENVASLVEEADYIVDMLDFHALKEKVALYRFARKHGKTVLTAPSVINGAVLYVFEPEGISFERFFGYDEQLPSSKLGERFLKRLIPRFPPEAPEPVYRAAARGERTIPLDAVGVDQASVMLVCALENLVLGRRDRVVFVPRGIEMDASQPARLAEIVDFSADFSKGSAKDHDPISRTVGRTSIR
jgi:molybdopterin/thiamine biosynthesis adenylyltransferase